MILIRQKYNYAIADHKGPVYLRFGRPKVTNFTPENQKFEIGKQTISKRYRR